MVAAHISELFRRSKACMHALLVLMRCKCDSRIHIRASSLYNLIDIHSKNTASIVNKAEPLQAHLLQAPIWRDSFLCFNQNQQNYLSGNGCFGVGQPSSFPQGYSVGSDKLGNCAEKIIHPYNGASSSSEKGIANFPVDASELANFLTLDRHIGISCSAKVLLVSMLREKQELCFSVVSLLWHKLIAAPEIQPCLESTSAQQGWTQVVDALCDVVSASPTKAAAAVVLQAERELRPWIAKDDDQGQMMWRINQRIIRLTVELMRNHERPELLVILASASDLLLRATNGLLIDGEACTLPQLELLEVTARAVQPVLDWGASGSAVADGLSNLLKCRLPATIRCLCHPSAHVRALSTSVLRDILHTGSIKSKQKPEGRNGIHGAYQSFNLDTVNWKADIEDCLMWEARRSLSSSMSLNFLNTAAKELGCRVLVCDEP
ncbi:hypothetical protein SAY87_000201 [Trapa incisa]|uniref:Gigantea n=1 Tax=Trapa incisa TaxID=236973 RepID=A0AAN7GGC3_9MYRT|nr:hypothetical protein SAY87_000201 [Trapa incisa]